MKLSEKEGKNCLNMSCRNFLWMLHNIHERYLNMENLFSLKKSLIKIQYQNK